MILHKRKDWLSCLKAFSKQYAHNNCIHMKRIHSLVHVNDNMAAQMNSLLNLNSMTEIVQVSFKLLSIYQDYKFEYKNKKKGHYWVTVPQPKQGQLGTTENSVSFKMFAESDWFRASTTKILASSPKQLRLHLTMALECEPINNF
jgi:hypothetical protein